MNRSAAFLALLAPLSASAFTLPRPFQDWQATEEYCSHNQATGTCNLQGVSNDTQGGAFDLGGLAGGQSLDTANLAPGAPASYLYGSDTVSLSHAGDLQIASAQDVQYYYPHGFDALLGFEVDQDWYRFTPERDLCFDVCFGPGFNDPTTPGLPTDWTLEVFDSTVSTLDLVSGPWGAVTECTATLVGDGTEVFMHVSDPSPVDMYPPVGYSFVVDASANEYQATWYPDVDSDGQGDATAAGTTLCGDPGPGLVANNDDCGDGDASIYLGATEICNGTDNDCDGTPDNGLPFAPYWPDGDDDGWGDETATPTDFCDDPGPGWSPIPEDCNDADDTIHPVNADDCDGIDNDCDGTVDEDATLTDHYPDVDGDGYGDMSAQPTGFCTDPGDGWTSSNDDCDDSDANANPGGTEIPYDGIDQDCDGRDACDQDGDGRRASECNGADCDDSDATITPDADEVWYDGIDQDCDGNDCDQDGDGLDAPECDGLDCDDTDPTVGECLDEGEEPWVQGGLLCSTGGPVGSLWLFGLLPLWVRRRV